MDQDTPYKPLVSRLGSVVDLGLTLLFFLFMREMLVPHVPSHDPFTILLVSGMTAFCMSGVFWLAAGMLRVTWIDYLRRQSKDR